MKKMIVTMAISLCSFAAFAKPDDVSPKVLNAFKTEFNSATEVEWVAGNGYYKAAFTYNDQHVFAFYSLDGELLGITRYISATDLPISLQTSLKKNYSDYWISDLFEVSKSDGTSYCITLEDADSKIVLKSSGNAWSVFKRVRKA
jgi:hypothetical protein